MKNDQIAMSVVQDWASEFGSLLPSDEWRNKSSQQEYKEDFSEDDR